jgi:hypothetical protein
MGKNKYAATDVSQLKKMKESAQENARLKKV